jgi:hypothetical protein
MEAASRPTTRRRPLEPVPGASPLCVRAFRPARPSPCDGVRCVELLPKDSHFDNVVPLAPADQLLSEALLPLNPESLVRRERTSVIGGDGQPHILLAAGALGRRGGRVSPHPQGVGQRQSAEQIPAERLDMVAVALSLAQQPQVDEGRPCVGHVRRHPAGHHCAIQPLVEPRLRQLFSDEAQTCVVTTSSDAPNSTRISSPAG